MQVNMDNVLVKLRAYFAWETKFDFTGWENIKIVTGDNLYLAWVKARPGDLCKFQNKAFKEQVLRSNGKFLEKQFERDDYKVIVAVGNNLSEDKIVSVIAHEIRHCLDYQAAVRDLSFFEYTAGNHYFNSWSEYRAVSVSVRCDFFLKGVQKNDIKEMFAALSAMLGRWNADCVEGLFKKEGDYMGKFYYLSRYLGASHAIQNLTLENRVPATSLLLWNMTPGYIFERYGYIYNLGDEWENLPICSLDATPQGPFYQELLQKLKSEKADGNESI